jgi:hypothetical protein
MRRACFAIRFKSWSSCCTWRGPDQEHRVDVLDARIESLGYGKISPNGLNLRWQLSCLRVSNPCANVRPLGAQLREDLAAKRAGAADNENPMHTELSRSSFLASLFSELQVALTLAF